MKYISLIDQVSTISRAKFDSLATIEDTHLSFVEKSYMIKLKKLLAKRFANSKFTSTITYNNWIYHYLDKWLTILNDSFKLEHSNQLDEKDFSHIQANLKAKVRKNALAFYNQVICALPSSDQRDTNKIAGYHILILTTIFFISI